LDPFQQYALKAIHQNHNVLICAKTGSGKTLVGEAAIYKVLASGGRIFYTAPIKALSNQKFSDFTKQFPDATVGLMTGDIRFQPDAQIVIMTTEVFLNLLLKKGSKTEGLGLTASLSITGVQAVIFDECHYINDRGRGKVWEQAFMNVPKSIQLVLLSATLANPEIFAGWLGILKEVPCCLIQTQYRIVPLTHAVLDPITDALIVTQTPGVEVYQEKAYRDWLQTRKDILDGHRKFQEKVANKVVSGEKGAVEGKVRPKTFVHQLNHTLGLLQTRNQLPALFFVFSRKGCEVLANQVTLDFLSSSETAAANHIIDFHLHKFKSLETLPQFHTLKSLLLKGIAFHHSGLLPLLKEIVEILFLKGLIKVLFATETFAVGLNMPTKTVVFTGLSKFDDENNGMRLLRTDEYIQMAGRAGRRGKDTEGLVIYLPEREPVTPHELRQIMKGVKEPVVSRMDFHYDFLLKTLNANGPTWLQQMEKSYWFHQRSRVKTQNAREILILKSQVETMNSLLTEEVKALIKQKTELEAQYKTAKHKQQGKIRAEIDALPLRPTDLTNYQTVCNFHRDLTELEAYQVSLENHSATIRGPVKFLRATGYLKESEAAPELLTQEDLTLKGLLATEINEGNPILMTELFMSKKAHDLSGPELATLLSFFLEDFDKNESYVLDTLGIPAKVKEAALSLNDESYRLGELEGKCGATKSETAWFLSLQWSELVYRWITEETHIAILCSEYNTFEGNVVRGILKLVNLLDEWLSMATYCNEASQIEKITALKPLLMRDIVMPNSLYLTKV
jgi:superfamily II RNA helicase